MQAELTAPAASAAAPPARFSFVLMLLKFIYAATASIFSVWLVSFTPGEGPGVLALVPLTNSGVVHVPGPAALIQFVRENPALRELLADDDANAVWPELRQRHDELLARLQKLPPQVQRFIPPTPEGIAPWLGSEWALVLPGADAGDKGTQKKRPFLLLAHVSGGKGLLTRLALRFAKPKQIALRDLGGGIIAAGFNGATLDDLRPAPPTFVFAAENGRVLLRGNVQTAVLQRASTPQPAENAGEILQEAGIPPAIQAALLNPPTLADIFRLQQMPEQIAFSLSVLAHGEVALSARLPGCMLPPGEAVSAEPAPHANAQGVLPLDFRALFLNYLEKQMRAKKGVVVISRAQRRWLTRLTNLREHGVDLETELWPAFGNTVSFNVTPATPEMTTDYGQLRVAIPFDAQTRSRMALGELIRERWEFLFDGQPPKGAKPPYVRRLRGAGIERYVLVTGNIAAPAWSVFDRHIEFGSDAGPFALLQTELPEQAPAAMQRAAEYYLRAEGAKLAGMAEAYATLHYDQLEEDLGTQEFLARYADAQQRIKLAGKLAQLAGKIDVRAESDETAHEVRVRLNWKPGSLTAPVQQE